MKNNKAWSPRPEKAVEKKVVYDTKKQTNTTSKAGFMNAVEKTVNSVYNLTYTENGALAHGTSGHKLLDMNFAVSSLRGKNDKEIYTMFREAFKDDPKYAIKFLFYARDVREGLGERNLFRVCIRDLINNGQKQLVEALIPVMAEYGRWDDVVVLIDTACKNAALAEIKKQWNKDIRGIKDEKPISLLAKWMPSEQASNVEVVHRASVVQKYLKMTPRVYRKNLSAMRKYIDVVERKMSSNNWQAIDYESVPSKANLIYNKAFLRHDEDRRSAYLNALTKGEAKINASVAYPHEIAHKYTSSRGGWYGLSISSQVDPAIEAMWKALPNLVKDNSSTIVVADGSGSMTSQISGTNISALEVANALAIYFAERCTGEFKNTYITFSEKPQVVHLDGDSLLKNLKIAFKHDEVANTNIEATFDLLLNTAIRNHMKQEDIPSNVLVLSDMQFDAMSCCNGTYRGGCNKALFDAMSERWERAGYHMPKLIFWNLMSRSSNSTIPMVENDAGVILVSGFSVNILKTVMSNKTDPYEALLETLDAPRYDAIEKIVNKTWNIA